MISSISLSISLLVSSSISISTLFVSPSVPPSKSASPSLHITLRITVMSPIPQSGYYLVSTSRDSSIKIWDLREGRLLFTLQVRTSRNDMPSMHRNILNVCPIFESFSHHQQGVSTSVCHFVVTDENHQNFPEQSKLVLTFPYDGFYSDYLSLSGACGCGECCSVQSGRALLLLR